MADAWVGKLQQMVLQSSKSVQNSESPPDADHGEDHPSVLQWPESSGKRALYLTTFPMLLLFFFTIVDGEKCHSCLWPMLYVRTDMNVNTGRGRCCLVRRKGKQGYFMLTMFSAVVWLAILAEGMMAAAERVGCMLEIDEDLMGLTVTAAGTSLPNLFASVLVARQGLGNMAVSNAFGSNTFNIFVALGFPWLVATLFLDPGSSYHVDKGHIFGSCMILVGILTMFLMLLGTANMKLTPCIGVIYLITYVLFMGYLVCPKTKHPNPKTLESYTPMGTL
jgi:Ca2+/Na+ antiporter